ncbi:MAG: alpha/beta hydrolase fold domain-containing protein [Deltaproteobacteria bacterium]|nr:alpha/beta hydrolase fold domain-containing protein [Deltaproteobacteria bacterium]
MNEIVYKGFRQDEMEYQYNPRESVPEYPQLAKKRAEQARKVRDTAQSWLDVPYGSSRREILDIFAADQTGGPVLIYIHGGYWRSGSKEDNCNFVPVFTKLGATVVLVEYDLCPAVTVSDIVRQTRSAIAWIFKNIMRYNGDPSKLYISGHSAGGHLTAMALAHDWKQEGLPRDFIKGAVATSGVYDLEMVMRISVQQQVRLTPELATENSPFLHPPRPICPVVIAVGGAEPKGWQQMSEDFFNLCKEHGVNSEYLIVPGANHYTMSEHLADPKSPLTQAMLKQMKF